MGIFKAIKTAWAAASTAEKIDLVLDIICGFGTGAISARMMKQMAPNMGKLERFCAGVAMSGLGMAAGEAAAKAYRPYTEAIGKVADKAKKNEPKEENENDEYTRY